MPFRSKSQQRAMHAKASRGEIDEKTIHEWDEATKHQPGGFKALPEKKAAAEGALAALDDLGLEKVAFLPALMAAGRAALPWAARGAKALMSGGVASQAAMGAGLGALSAPPGQRLQGAAVGGAGGAVGGGIGKMIPGMTGQIAGQVGGMVAGNALQGAMG